MCTAFIIIRHSMNGVVTRTGVQITVAYNAISQAGLSIV